MHSWFRFLLLQNIGPDKVPLSWSTRLKIAAGVAWGLEHLHCMQTYCWTQISAPGSQISVLLSCLICLQVLTYRLEWWEQMVIVRQNTPQVANWPLNLTYIALAFFWWSQSLGVRLLTPLCPHRSKTLSLGFAPCWRTGRSIWSWLVPCWKGDFLLVRAYFVLLSLQECVFRRKPIFAPLVAKFAIVLEYLASETKEESQRGVTCSIPSA